MANSLASLARAIGVHRGAYEVARLGGASTPQLQRMGELFTTLDVDAQGSLARLCAELPNLPTLSLTGELLAVEHGDHKATVAVRIDASPGAVWWTTFDLHNGWPVKEYTGTAEGASHEIYEVLGPDTFNLPYSLRLRRAGLTSSGVWTHDIYIGAVWVPPPPPPPPPPPLPAQRPHIEVTHSMDGLNASFVVKGTGFLASQPDGPAGITIQAVESATLAGWVHVYTGSDAAAGIYKELGPLDVSTLQPNALGQRRVTFTATDSRKDPTSVPANAPLWSNPFDVTF